ncbi:monocarboxylate transporter 9-like isoform X2 [Lytechinus variegatus]|uniref:monocarboxylate transporter 9-like isoform X2 n=1 Tax=Lytechinus variegatus TaxID=7654 RepID=UPI001BB246E1|nr:monocarboxylate transporter 9-like isoform X2 [Lytechinus variegatus]
MASSRLHHHWGWVVTGATCIAFYFSYGFILSFSVLFVTFQREFGSSATSTAWVGSLPFGLSAIVAPLVNLLIERIGYRAVVVIGISMISLGLILTSFMQSLAPMYFTYSALFGVGTGCILMGSLNLILKYFPRENATGGVVLPMASSNLGMLSLGPLTFYLENKFGWRNTLRIGAGMIMGIALPAVAWAHREPRRPSTPEETKDMDEGCTVKLKAKETNDARAFEDSMKDIEDAMIDIGQETDEWKETREHCHTDYTSDMILYTYQSNSQTVGQNTDQDEQSGRTFLGQENCHRLTEKRPNQYDKTIRNTCNVEKEWKPSRSFKTLEENVLEHATSGMTKRMLTVLTFPDVWFMSLAVFGYGLTNSFFLVQLVSYMMSLGFSEEDGAHTVVALGVSMLVGKVTLALISDYIPFHQLYLSTVASVLGISVMICLLQAPGFSAVMCMVVILGATVFSISDALPYFSPNLVFGVTKGRETAAILAFMHGVGLLTASVLGESLDQTGSYNLALYMCIGTYALCGLFCIMVPVYQKCMVRDRFVMTSWKGCQRRQASGSESTQDVKNKI